MSSILAFSRAKRAMQRPRLLFLWNRLLELAIAAATVEMASWYWHGQPLQGALVAAVLGLVAASRMRRAPTA
jgi:hypothetical protein